MGKDSIPTCRQKYCVGLWNDNGIQRKRKCYTMSKRNKRNGWPTRDVDWKSKIGKKIKGKIINTTISREKNNKYYVSVVYEIPNIKNIIPSSIVGIDIGIKKLITLSDSSTYENNKYIEKYEKRIKRVQRELTRKKKGSKNYFKCKKKLNILYIKLSNARKYYTHKITKEITDNYDIIACEWSCSHAFCS